MRRCVVCFFAASFELRRPALLVDLFLIFVALRAYRMIPNGRAVTGIGPLQSRQALERYGTKALVIVIVL